LTEWEKGMPQLRVVDLVANTNHRLDFPEPVYDVSLKDNPEFNTKTVQFSYNSYVTPPSVYQYNLETRQPKLLKKKEVLGGYDPTKYESELLHATATDGTKVPISLARKKGV